jgi:hypothetical protein
MPDQIYRTAPERAQTLIGDGWSAQAPGSQASRQIGQQPTVENYIKNNTHAS